MKCKKDCKEKVHFISPEMSSLFDEAVVNMPDGSEKHFSITQPRKWRVKGSDFGSTPLQAHFPVYTVTTEVRDGVKYIVPHIDLPKVIYNSTYTGIDKRDQYYKDIRKINRFVTRLYGA